MQNIVTVYNAAMRKYAAEEENGGFWRGVGHALVNGLKDTGTNWARNALATPPIDTANKGLDALGRAEKLITHAEEHPAAVVNAAGAGLKQGLETAYQSYLDQAPGAQEYINTPDPESPANKIKAGLNRFVAPKQAPKPQLPEFNGLQIGGGYQYLKPDFYKLYVEEKPVEAE